MARVLILLSLVTMVAGLVVAWPLVRAAWSFTPVHGEVLDVLTLPEPDGRLRVAIAYEYPLPARGEHALGYTQSDERLRPIADPVLDAALANRLRQALPGRKVRIFYDANHPLDSAFMLSPTLAPDGLRAEHGTLLVMAGIALGILGQLARLRR
jgi:hypothetical protein